MWRTTNTGIPQLKKEDKYRRTTIQEYHSCRGRINTGGPQIQGDHSYRGRLKIQEDHKITNLFFHFKRLQTVKYSKTLIIYRMLFVCRCQQSIVL